MRNLRDTFPRLLIIYEHFNEGNLNEDYSWYPKFFLKLAAPVIVIGKKRSYYDAFPFAYGELTYLFSEWQKWPNGKIRYVPKPNLDEDEGLRHFLGLNVCEFAHLFIPTMQSTDFGGAELDIDATPQQVAANLKIFLEMILDKKSKGSKKVL